MAEVDRTENDITWEVVPPERLAALVANTITQSLIQPLTGTAGWVELLGSDRPQFVEKRPEYLGNLARDFTQLQDSLKILERLLKSPDQPFPINHRHESSGGEAFIDLKQTLKP